MAIDKAERHEEAFRIWCTNGEQSDRKTAESMGVSQRSVNFWRHRDDWQRRWLSMMAPEAEAAANQGRSLMRLGMPLVAQRMLSILGEQRPMRDANGNTVKDETGNPRMEWASSDRDAIQAAKLLSQYGFEGGAGQDSTVYDTQAILLPEVGVPDGEESVADLRRRASAMLEATVQSVNTRVTSTNQRRKCV